MQVSPEDYRSKVLSHLQEHCPKQYREAVKEGSLSRLVDGLCQAIANWVNSQVKDVGPAAPGEPLQNALRRQNSARMMAESDALREYLPRDEASQAQIRDGAYVD